MGVFDDVFEEDWGLNDGDDDADIQDNQPDEFESDLWNTGSKTDEWNTDEPWSSERTPEEEEKKDSFNMSDFI